MRFIIITFIFIVYLLTVINPVLAETDNLHPAKSFTAVFVRNNNIWRTNGDGSGQKMIIKNGVSPAFSPDKKQIAFARNNNIWVADINGSNQKQLTHIKQKSPYSSSLITISWNPRHKQIMFSYPRDNRIIDKNNALIGMSIYRIYINGNKPKLELMFYMMEDSADYHFSDSDFPAWNKNGEILAFSRNGDLWVAYRYVDYDDLTSRPGYDINRLISTAWYDEATYRASRTTLGLSGISWSPNGSTLAYSISRQGGTGVDEIHIVNFKLEPNSTIRVQSDTKIVFQAKEPRFSPDGKHIAYWAYDNDIYITTLDGKQDQLLIKNASQFTW